MQNKNEKTRLKQSFVILCDFALISQLNINFHVKFPQNFWIYQRYSFATYYFIRQEYSLLWTLLITIFIIRQSEVRFPLTIYILLGIQYVSREGIINLCEAPLMALTDASIHTKEARVSRRKSIDGAIKQDARNSTLL